MRYPIFKCSPVAAQRIESYDDTLGIKAGCHHLKKYPFESLHIGESFQVFANEGKVKSLRTLVTRRNKETGKTFLVVNHKEFEVYEVARIK